MHQREEASRHAKEHGYLAGVLDSSPSFAHVLRGLELFEYVKAAYRRLVGRDEFVGRPAFEALPEAASGGFQETILQVMRTGVPYRGKEMPVTLQRVPGGPEETRYVDVTYVPLPSPDGSCERVAGHGSDVTEHVLSRRKAVREGADARERLSLALGTARMSTWEWTPATGALSFSEALPSLFGSREGAPTGSPEDWQRAIVPEDRDRHALVVARAAESSGAWSAEFRVEAVDGNVRWLEELAQASRDVETDELRIVGIVWDVTGRKRHEIELREADRRKDVFLATLAHELRNPLAPLRNGLEIMKLTADTNPRAAAVRAMMERQLAQMVRLIDDLMDVGRIASGKIELRREHSTLADALSAAIEASRSQLDAHGVHLDVRIAPGTIVNGDKARLSQVFANLLSNAAKFTQRGGLVEARAWTEGGQAIVSIADNGAGVPADALEAIFGLFAQASVLHPRAAWAKDLRSHANSWIAWRPHRSGQRRRRQRLALHGMVAVHRTAIEVDAAAPAPFGLPATVSTALQRVLVVDDNVDAADSLAEALWLRGHDARLVYGGEEALEECVRDLPDVVLMDIGMPGRDGREIALK